MIEVTNWTHCIYKSTNDNDHAQISIGAEWIDNSSKECFFVSHLDENHLLVEENIFSELEEAVYFINNNFSRWEFVDLEVINKKSKKDEGGCGSCKAH